MKKAVLLTIVIVCAACVPAAAFGSLPSTEIYGSVSFGGLLSGFQKDMPDQLLYPVPDSYSALTAIIGIRHFFAGALGIEGSFGVMGTTSAMSSLVSEPLTVYDYHVATLGLIVRYPVALDYSSFLTVSAGGGATYSLLSLSTQFTSPFEAAGFYFYGINPDFGWYGKLGIGYYPMRNLFFDVTAYYTFLNAQFDVSGKQLEGTYFLIAVTLGVAF